MSSLRSDDIELKIRSATSLAIISQHNKNFQNSANNIGLLDELIGIITSITNSEKKEEENKNKKLKYTQEVDPLPLPEDMKPEIELLQNTIKALAYISSMESSIRNKLFEKQQYKAILELTKHHEPGIRASASLCLVFLSRGGRFPKSLLITDGIIPILQRLIYDPYLDVETSAVGILCNLSIEFQTELCENDICVKRTIEFIQSKYYDLKFRAIICIKNLLYKTTPEIRKFILSRMTIEKLIELLDDESVEIQIHTICAMRNIFYEKHDWVNDTFCKSSLEKILQKIEEKINCSISELVFQTIFLLSNITNVNDKFKTMILGSSILKGCAKLLEGQSNIVKVAVMSFFINMLGKCKHDNANFIKQKKIFQDLMIEDSLNKLNVNPDSKIKKKALQLLTYLT